MLNIQVQVFPLVWLTYTVPMGAWALGTRQTKGLFLIGKANILAFFVASHISRLIETHDLDFYGACYHIVVFL